MEGCGHNFGDFDGLAVVVVVWRVMDMVRNGGEMRLWLKW